MTYKFNQNVNREEYLAFYKYHVVKNFMSPTKLIFSAVFFGALLSGAFFGYPEMTYAGVALIVMTVYMMSRLSKSGGKIFDKNPEAFSYDYTLDDNNLSFKTDEGSNTKPWKEFVKYFEDDKYIFIFTKTNKGLMFCKGKLDPETIKFILGKCEENKARNPFKRK